MNLLIGFGIAVLVLLIWLLILLWIIATLLSRGVKLETIAVLAKALCFITIGLFTPMTTGLAQWVNSGDLPGPLIWIVTGASCFVGAAGQLLSFLSGSYSDYMAGRKPSTNGGFDTSLTPKPPQAQIQPTNQPANPAQPIP